MQAYYDSSNRMEPGYLKLYQEGKLRECADRLFERMKACDLCPHACGVDRTAGETGICNTGTEATIASWAPHFGEESPLVGRRGSGTIFFSNCNLECIYCQNSDISQQGYGRNVSPEQLGQVMVALQEEGCHNINFVSPTHVVHQIVEALSHAVKIGLHIPLVYNSGGYDSVETLRCFEGIIDIYMPDLKYADPETGYRLSGVRDYPQRAFEAVREMHRQVGDLVTDGCGIAEGGLIIRHLVLPNDLAGTARISDFVAELSTNTYYNLMDQYHPDFQAYSHADLHRRTSLVEFNQAKTYAKKLGLNRLAR